MKIIRVKDEAAIQGFLLEAEVYGSDAEDVSTVVRIMEIASPAENARCWNYRVVSGDEVIGDDEVISTVYGSCKEVFDNLLDDGEIALRVTNSDDEEDDESEDVEDDEDVDVEEDVEYDDDDEELTLVKY